MASIDYYGKPNQTLDELLKKYNSSMYLIIDDVLDSHKSCRFIYQDLLDILKLGFEDKSIRTYPIRFKFHKADKKFYTLEVRHLLSNLIFWNSFIDMEKVDILDETYIIDFRTFNQNAMIDYINNKILIHHEGDFASKNKCVDEICYSMNAISNAFSLLMGLSVNIYDIIQTEYRHPEMSKLIFTPFDTSKQPVEIEEELKERSNRLIEIFKTDTEENVMKPFFAAGNILSPDQFKEMFIRIGFKSDVNGHTIPNLIDASFLVTGLNKPSYAYINSLGGRKSMILTKLAITSPGAFAKKLNSLSTSASQLRKDYEMCNSTETITYHINDDKFLSLLDGRYYYDSHGVMHQLNYEKDKHLIGLDVRFRSPTTCSSKEGICKYCYGKLFDINKDMFSVGALSATKITEPLGQAVLSSKHSQVTNSSSIQFSEDFDKLFELNSTEISLNDNSDIDDEMFLQFDDIRMEESDDVEYYYTNKFRIIDTSGKVIYNIAEENDANMYLSDQLLAIYKKMKDKSKPISLDNFDSDGDILFTVEIKNKELTEPVKMIQKILNSNDKLGAKSLSDVCQIFAETLISMGSKYDLVHAESIIRGLLRKKTNDLEFPDWTNKGDHNDYQIMRVNMALFKNPSALVSIAYGDLRRQLISAELYEKSAPSHLDTLFTSVPSNYIEQ